MKNARTNAVISTTLLLCGLLHSLHTPDVVIYQLGLLHNNHNNQLLQSQLVSAQQSQQSAAAQQSQQYQLLHNMP
jgi:hypothetical protein